VLLRILLQVGRFKNSVNIPLVNAKWVYNAEEGKKVVQKEDNEQFLAQVSSDLRVRRFFWCHEVLRLVLGALAGDTALSRS
jgi:hypothetical protein